MSRASPLQARRRGEWAGVGGVASLDQNQSLARTRLGGRKYHVNVKTTFWSGANLDLCVVSISDGADDRQAEADTLSHSMR